MKNSIQLQHKADIAHMKASTAKLIEDLSKIEVTSENYSSIIKSLNQSTKTLKKVVQTEYELSCENGS
ncbi:hypothetical protein [Spartinivicinus ruber]|uniref:hypothetical protein n=1 Tax=Spartinivicinus ruber TaxID=2683272 RepID=UPI0013D263ED|nr:hypothetical protein [Spartinivicinus ruber]